MNQEELRKTIRQRRIALGLTLKELAAMSGISASYLGRLERGDRFPSARVLRKIAQPLNFSESEVFTLAGYLSQPPGEAQLEKLDPYVAAVLSQEPAEIQRAVITILSVLKSMAKESGCSIDFAEYIHRKYPEIDEDIITMVKDILEHPPDGSR